MNSSSQKRPFHHQVTRKILESWILSFSGRFLGDCWLLRLLLFQIQTENHVAKQQLHVQTFQQNYVRLYVFCLTFCFYVSFLSSVFDDWSLSHLVSTEEEVGMDNSERVAAMLKETVRNIFYFDCHLIFWTCFLFCQPENAMKLLFPLLHPCL